VSHVGSNAPSGAPSNDVRRYGATGDGHTDDTTAIQSAIDAVSAGGGTVYFPAGNYRYRRLLIRRKKKLALEGQHASLIETIDGGGVTGVDSPGLIIRGLTFDHASHNGYILDVTSVDATIEDNTFENLGDGLNTEVNAAIYIAPNSDRASVRHNSFVRLRGSLLAAVRAVYINNYRSKKAASRDARIVNNHFDTITAPIDGDCVVIDQQGLTSSASIEANTFYNCSKRAVKLMSNDNVVRSNTITVHDLKAQSYSAVSSYGDRNQIIENVAKAVGCNRGCSFYSAWELSGDDNVLTNNTAENPSDTVDTSIDCVMIVRPEDRQALHNIFVRGNSCRKFRYIRVRRDTPVENLVIQGNQLTDCIAQSAVSIYPSSPISGLSFINNTGKSEALLLAFQESGSKGKATFDIRANTGLLELNLGDDPAPVSIKAESSRIFDHGVEITDMTNGHKRARGSGPPNGGYWRVGDLVLTSNSGAEGRSGWRCVSAGVPGNWVRFGS
jgi:nitrous oxidase accessory protein NosD